MDVAQLQEQFAVPGVLAFETTPSGLITVQVTAPAAEATIYLQGAHITHWKPAGQAPVLFLSPRSDLAPGKAIRGGVPICFPWFAGRHDGKSGPSHGFARISDWTLAFAAVAGDEVHLTFTLAPNDLSRSLGYDHFKLAYRVVIGRTLTLELTVANDSGSGGMPTTRDAEATMATLGAPLLFEEALHSYYSVGDVRTCTITGLAGTTFIDKRDDLKHKVQPAGPLALTGTTDRVYLDTTATCVIDDTAQERRIAVAKTGSHTTIVWNPWAELAATMSDLPPDAWPGMLCVETANADSSAITLAPGQTHTMQLHVSVDGNTAVTG